MRSSNGIPRVSVLVKAKHGFSFHMPSFPKDVGLSQLSEGEYFIDMNL